jgi:hypothetical protein
MTPSPPTVRAIVARYAEDTADNRVFFHPDIPEHRLASALSAYPGIEPEDVLVLLDNTESGDGTEGLLLTEEAVRVRNGSHVECHVALRDLQSAAITSPSPSALAINRTAVLSDLRVRPQTMNHVLDMLNKIAGTLRT